MDWGLQNAENPLRGVKNQTNYCQCPNKQRQKHLISALWCMKTNFMNVSKWTILLEELFLAKMGKYPALLIYIIIPGLGKP